MDGYIVYGSEGCYELCKEKLWSDEPKTGLLLYGSVATVFKTRSRARSAIKSSKSYSTRKQFQWGPWFIKKVVSE